MIFIIVKGLNATKENFNSSRRLLEMYLLFGEKHTLDISFLSIKRRKTPNL